MDIQGELILEEILDTFQETNDYDYQPCSDDFNMGAEKMLLIDDYDDLKKLNTIAIEKLLEKNIISQEDVYNHSADDDLYFIEEILKQCGVCFGFTDEYIRCDDCFHIIPYQENGWLETFIRDENDDVVCDSCIQNNPNWYIDNYLLLEPRERFNLHLTDEVLTKCGYRYIRTVSYEENIDLVYNEYKTETTDVIFSEVNYKLEVWVKGDLENG